MTKSTDLSSRRPKRRLGIPERVKAQLRRRHRLPALWYIGPLEETEMPKTWPNGVPYIDEDTRTENLRDPAKLYDLIRHLHLHDAYSGYGLVRTMTTEQKELYADVLDLDCGDPELDRLKFDRWWHR